jgi:pyruvate ferredoxin oxidoreductase gamma subunit
LGRAGFVAGLHTQDFSLFGAERRGAPVVACTRLSEQPIDRRGYIEAPDLVVVMDDSLLQEVQQQVLQGVRPDTPVFINTSSKDLTLATANLPGRFIPVDLTGIARQILGGSGFLSAAAAGAAARCAPSISPELLTQAVRLEVKEFGLTDALVRQNEEAARAAYFATTSLSLEAKQEELAVAPAPVEIAALVTAPGFSGPTIRHPASASLRDTGSWRMERPEIELAKCKRCFLCYLYCPETAIQLDAEAYPHVDYDHCKGCMICYQECPTAAISERVES